MLQVCSRVWICSCSRAIEFQLNDKKKEVSVAYRYFFIKKIDAQINFR